MQTQPLEPLLKAEQRQALLAVARRSIALGLAEGRPLRVHPEDYAAELRAQRPGDGLKTGRPGFPFFRRERA